MTTTTATPPAATPPASTTAPAAAPPTPAAPATTADPAGNTAPAAITDPAPATAPAPGEGTGGSDPPAAPGAPAEYAAFTLPEGYVLEGERLDTLVAFAKTNNWTQAQAQAAVDKHIELSEQGVAMVREAKVKAWDAAAEAEYGQHYEAIVTDAKAAIAWAQKDRPSLLKTFEDEGWGSHPDALWALAQLGRLTREAPVQGLGNETAGSPPAAKSPAAILYPDLVRKT